MTQHHARNDDPRWIPYRGPRPTDARPEIVVADVLPEDSRLWVPIGDKVWSRPLSFVPTQGYWVHLLRVARSGVFNRHRHASPVHGYVLKGRWYYLEHEWEATEGSYVFEPPGETHTLVVPDGVEEMIERRQRDLVDETFCCGKSPPIKGCDPAREGVNEAVQLRVQK